MNCCGPLFNQRPYKTRLWALVARGLVTGPCASSPGILIARRVDLSSPNASSIRGQTDTSASQGLAALPGPKNAPGIAIVGAGLAGLNAAYQLGKRGLASTVYEASERVGGRVRSDTRTFGSDVVTESGGEFIDSTHKDMLALTRELSLPLIDMVSASEASLAPGYYFGGQHRTEAEIILGVRDVLPRIAADVASLSKQMGSRRHSEIDRRFDCLPLSEYLDEIGISGWLRSLLEVAYATEYGLDVSEQSSLNFLSLFNSDVSPGFEIFGASDQRFKVAGGNELIAQRLSERISRPVHLERRLVQIRTRGGGYRLVFDAPGRTDVVDADIVVLTLPFTLLRLVDVGDIMPPSKHDAIRNIGMGTNAKLLLETRTRLWRDQGRDGDLYGDFPFQTGWDASRLRSGTTGVFTFFLGGHEGESVGRESVESLAASGARQLDPVFPGFKASSTGNATRIHWPTEPFSLGSYTCLRPGQWTTIADAVGRRVGNLFFAGEHCSREFQGFMNGAAQSGRHAAEAIVKSLL